MALKESETLKVLLKPRAAVVAFKQLDTDSKGCVSLDAFQRFAAGMLPASPTKAAGAEAAGAASASPPTDVAGDNGTLGVDNLFKLIDKDGSGTVEKSEIYRAVRGDARVREALKESATLKVLLKPRAAVTAFKALDTDSKGCVSLEAFRRFASGMQPARPTQAAAAGARGAGGSPSPSSSSPAAAGPAALTAAGAAQVEAIFKLLDKDGSGTIEKSEVYRAVRGDARVRAALKQSAALSVLLKPRAAAEAFKELDTDRSGCVSLVEFRRFAAGMQPAQPARPTQSDEAQEIFQMLDRDKSGTVEKSEIYRAIRNEAAVRDRLRRSSTLKLLLKPGAFGKGFDALRASKGPGASTSITLDDFRRIVNQIVPPPAGAAAGAAAGAGDDAAAAGGHLLGKPVRIQVKGEWRAGLVISFLTQKGHHLVHYSSGEEQWINLEQGSAHVVFEVIDFESGRAADVDDCRWLVGYLEKEIQDAHLEAEIKAELERERVADPAAHDSVRDMHHLMTTGLVAVEERVRLLAALHDAVDRADGRPVGTSAAAHAADAANAAHAEAWAGAGRERRNSLDGIHPTAWVDKPLKIQREDGQWETGVVAAWNEQAKMHVIALRSGDTVEYDSAEMQHAIIDLTTPQGLQDCAWLVRRIEDEAAECHAQNKPLRAAKVQLLETIRNGLARYAAAAGAGASGGGAAGGGAAGDLHAAANRVLHDQSVGGEQLVDDLLRVEWSGGVWHSGVIVDFDAASGQHQVLYEDGERHWHDMRVTRHQVVEILDHDTLEGWDWAVGLVQADVQAKKSAEHPIPASRWDLLRKLYLVQVIDHPLVVRQDDGSVRRREDEEDG